MMPSWLGFTMTFRRPKPQPRHGALEKSVVWGTGPAPLRLGSWPHVLSSGVRVLPRFLFKAWVLALGVVGGTGPAPLRLGSWPHAAKNQEAFKKHSRSNQEAIRKHSRSIHAGAIKVVRNQSRQESVVNVHCLDQNCIKESFKRLRPAL